MIYYSKNNLEHYLNFLDNDPEVKQFLRNDIDFRLADNYLLGITFLFLQSVSLPTSGYSSMSFFSALCLAHILEEDDVFTNEIQGYALSGLDGFPNAKFQFQKLIIYLLLVLGQNACVRRCCIEQVMELVPHDVWLRRRGNKF